VAKTKNSYVCSGCGGSTPRWAGQCPDCREWNTLVERADEPEGSASSRYTAWSGKTATAVKLRDVQGADYPRVDTGFEEFNRVLGGGLVPGSVTLIGGEPGIGKSTLLLQAMAKLAARDLKVLYGSGEESTQQIALRAKRLGLEDSDITLLPEVDLEKIIASLDKEQPRIVVIDSIQTVFTGQLQSAPGSVAQVRECAAHLTRYAKAKDVSVILVGHVTKEGAIAGPRVLEHMVDTVLYFEGEPGSSFRMIRAFKNRFGAVNEMAVFAMGEQGLEEVSNPSSMFLTQHEKPVAGSCILAALEGNRPFLVEVQALVEDSASPNVRRFASGFDLNRLQLLLAILAKHTGTVAADQNVYLKVVGGIRLTEPASDLAALMAAHSSLVGKPLPSGLIVFGEVGLAGELRPVQDAESRLKEAAKLGFTHAIIPAGNQMKKPVPGITVKHAARVDLALQYVRELRGGK
jgi:DNA repair protein RadA/Sms